MLPKWDEGATIHTNNKAMNAAVWRWTITLLSQHECSLCTYDQSHRFLQEEKSENHEVEQPCFHSNSPESPHKIWNSTPIDSTQGRRMGQRPGSGSPTMVIKMNVKNRKQRNRKRALSGQAIATEGNMMGSLHVTKARQRRHPFPFFQTTCKACSKYIDWEKLEWGQPLLNKDSQSRGHSKNDRSAVFQTVIRAS